MKGIIIKALSGFYYLSDGEKTYQCKARGSFRKSGVSPLVGDSAEFEPISETDGIVTAVLTRRNRFFRPPVANIDKLFIVSSFENPAPNAYIIDKLTAIAEYNSVEPIIVFNKSDLGDFARWEDIYLSAGFKVCTVSAATGAGIQALCDELKGCVSAFTGNSGAGKSSLLNCVLGDARLETGGISEKLGRGRHTTRHTELFKLPFGGFVADTPGFSSIEYDGGDYSFKENLISCFRDLYEYSDDCKFTSCTHTCEKGCAVIDAVNNGLLRQSRHSSYKELYGELRDLKPWNTQKRK